VIEVQLRGELAAVADTDLVERAFEMILHGVRGQPQRLGDLGIGVPADSECDDLALRGGQPADVGETWRRLTVLKARLDPQSVFAFNQNIPPATGRA
jgi:hypothetical protein